MSSNNMNASAKKTSTSPEARSDSAIVSVFKSTEKVQVVPKLSPHQLDKLKSGPRVHIFVGPVGSQYVGVERACVGLLTYYSGYARKVLLGRKPAVGLSILNGAKIPVFWIYRYMHAGENNPVGLERFDELAIADLVVLHSHCAVLEYQQLMDRTFARIHQKLYHSLPDVPTIKFIAAFAPSINELVAKAIARIMLQPLKFDYEPYMKHAATDKAFNLEVGLVVQDMLKQRIAAGMKYYNKDKSNRYVVWSNQYYRRLASRSRPSPVKQKKKIATIPTKLKKQKNSPPDSKGPKVQHGQRQENDVAISKRNGHLEYDPSTAKPPVSHLVADERQPTEPPPQEVTSTRPKPEFGTEKRHRYASGHSLGERAKKADGVARDPSAIKATRRPPICFACNEEGHIVRNCPAPPVAYLRALAERKRGRERYYLGRC